MEPSLGKYWVGAPSELVWIIHPVPAGGTSAVASPSSGFRPYISMVVTPLLSVPYLYQR